ncbi:MAG TPA: NAD(P)-dependent oxidoreductase [Candidatus Saccharibacteria bacterium]|jgi:3-hydroxyisobutyrate dehydrogenase-like beta-hydroxyacid dehydrogenase|nr:NAD(P)-dependent oxidoreductase [Candidatus Saccharibacteria bacterium]
MKIGFIGLGNMGSGMAKKLLTKDFDVLGFDVDDKKQVELEVFGLQKAANTADIAKVCELVVLCLPNPNASRSVIFEQLLVEGSNVQTIVETSTLTPEIVAEFAKGIEDKGKQFLSTPMIGGKNHALSGTIEFLVEGSSEVFEANQSIFEAMGNKARFMGDIPSATLAKLTFNLSRYANLAVGVETHRLLQKYHANIPAIYEFMSEQSLDNFGQVWKEDLKEMMTRNVPFRPSQVPKKDLALLAEMAKSRGLDDELIEAIRNTYLTME